MKQMFHLFYNLYHIVKCSMKLLYKLNNFKY